jgi:SAM-dependent methyltransferase
MRKQIETFATEAIGVLPFTPPIVEIGARPAEGQEGSLDLRQLFPGQEYIGCDIQPGPRVDQIEDMHHLSFADESIGALLALDTLEHVADPRRAMEEVWRVLRPGGITLISSVMFFPIHAHPWDFWRFTPEGFSQLLEPFENRLVMAYGWDLMPETVFGIGIKGPNPALTESLFPDTAKSCREWGKDLPVDFGPIRLTVPQMWGHTWRATTAAVRRRVTSRPHPKA